MPTGEEVAGSQSQIEATLNAGVEQISQREQIQFQRYEKVVLEQDGFVFWVATGETMVVSGSLHYAVDRIQAEDETIGTNNVLLTSEKVVSELNRISPQSMWIGNWPIEEDAPPLLVAFAQLGNFYNQAQIWHYSGFAVYPALKSQIINNAADLPPGPIVSNSLPVWLWYDDIAPVYPSFLVPDNISPPYIVAHVMNTEALAAAPFVGNWPGVTLPDSGASPLHELPVSTPARDEVRLTLYGFSNQLAWQYLQSLIEASVNDAFFGFANSPIPVDEKRTQVELAALAQKKTLTIVANYTQGTVDGVARRLILSVGTPSLLVIGGVQPRGAGEVAQAEQLAVGEGNVFE